MSVYLFVSTLVYHPRIMKLCNSVFHSMLRMYSTIKWEQQNAKLFLIIILVVFVHNIHFNNSFSNINFFLHNQIFKLLKSEVTSSQWRLTLRTCCWRSNEENINTIETSMKNKMNNTVPKTGLAYICLLPDDFACQGGKCWVMIRFILLKVI